MARSRRAWISSSIAASGPGLEFGCLLAQPGQLALRGDAGFVQGFLGFLQALLQRGLLAKEIVPGGTFLAQSLQLPVARFDFLAAGEVFAQAVEFRLQPGDVRVCPVDFRLQVANARFLALHLGL